MACHRKLHHPSLSLSLSTTVLTPIACVSSAVRQICVTRKEGRGGVRDYHESHERTWLVKLNHHPSTRIRVRLRAVHSPSPLRDSSLFCLLSQVEKWSQVGREVREGSSSSVYSARRDYRFEITGRLLFFFLSFPRTRERRFLRGE